MVSGLWETWKPIVRKGLHPVCKSLRPMPYTYTLIEVVQLHFQVFYHTSVRAEQGNENAD